MEYLVAFALLVAMGAWVVSSYLRLFHLYERVQGAWLQWTDATRLRNECLGDFLQAFASYLPQGDMLPRDMRRWAEDSERALSATAGAPRRGNFAGLGSAERHLRRVVSHSVHTLVTTRNMREDAHLCELCAAMSASLYRQEELAGVYNRSVAEYNSALRAPGARMVAGLFGFAPMAAVS